MKETTTVQQLMKKLLDLSSLNQEEFANAAGLTQGFISYTLQQDNIKMKNLKKFFVAANTEMIIKFGNWEIKRFDYALFSLSIQQLRKLSKREVSLKIGVGESTFKSRLKRNSVSIQDLRIHFEGLGEELIFLINNVNHHIK